VRPDHHVHGVHEVSHRVNLLGLHAPGLVEGAGRPDLHRRVAVPEPDCGQGVLVAGQDESVVDGEVRTEAVVDVRVDHGLGQHRLVPGTQFVDGHQLLVQVVEGRPGRLEPVLEGHDEPHPRVLCVEVAHRGDRQGDECTVLGDAEGSRTGQIGGRRGVVGVMTPADDDVVSPGEESGGLVTQGVVGQVLGSQLPPRSAEPGVEHGLDVSASGGVGEVLVLPGAADSGMTSPWFICQYCQGRISNRFGMRRNCAVVASS